LVSVVNYQYKIDNVMGRWILEETIMHNVGSKTDRSQLSLPYI